MKSGVERLYIYIMAMHNNALINNIIIFYCFDMSNKFVQIYLMCQFIINYMLFDI